MVVASAVTATAATDFTRSLKDRTLACRISDLLIASLFERRPNLQSLRMTTARGRVVHADIATALRNSCPRLDELALLGELGADEDLARMISASIASGHDAHLHAQDSMDISASEEQWACRSLEQFSCKIIGVLRSDMGLDITALVDLQNPHSQSALEAS
ncbi:hypothetical protein BGZ47_001863 [Haplosporangium gracile]|nr:hypothetical protein BGZ47_001863 [Haplosporangium gracile]